MLKKLAAVSGIAVALSVSGTASAMGPLIMAAPAIGHMLGIGAMGAAGMAAGAGAMAAGGMAAGAGMAGAAGTHMAAGTAAGMGPQMMAGAGSSSVASSDFAGWPLAHTPAAGAQAAAPADTVGNTAMWTATGASTRTGARTR